MTHDSYENIRESISLTPGQKRAARTERAKQREDSPEEL
jgi:hypothetical protein